MVCSLHLAKQPSLQKGMPLSPLCFFKPAYFKFLEFTTGILSEGHESFLMVQLSHFQACASCPGWLVNSFQASAEESPPEAFLDHDLNPGRPGPPSSETLQNPPSIRTCVTPMHEPLGRRVSSMREGPCFLLHFQHLAQSWVQNRGSRKVNRPTAVKPGFESSSPIPAPPHSLSNGGFILNSCPNDVPVLQGLLTYRPLVSQLPSRRGGWHPLMTVSSGRGRLAPLRPLLAGGQASLPPCGGARAQWGCGHRAGAVLIRPGPRSPQRNILTLSLTTHSNPRCFICLPLEAWSPEKGSISQVWLNLCRGSHNPVTPPPDPFWLSWCGAGPLSGQARGPRGPRAPSSSGRPPTCGSGGSLPSWPFCLRTASSEAPGALSRYQGRSQMPGTDLNGS